MINHRRDCSHAQTPAARRACREAGTAKWITQAIADQRRTDKVLAEAGTVNAPQPATWHVVPKASRRRPAYQVGERREIPNGNVIITQVRQADGTWWNIDVSIAPQYR